MSKVVSLPFGGEESPQSVLFEIAHRKDIEGFALLIKDKDGMFHRTTVNMQLTELAFCGAVLTNVAYEQSRD